MPDVSSASFRTLASEDSIPPDFVVPCYIADQKRRISIARVGRNFYAFDDLCPCGGNPCPLSGGLLSGTTIMCQCHGSTFDLSSGAVLAGPAVSALEVYPLKSEGGSIQVLI